MDPAARLLSLQEIDLALDRLRSRARSLEEGEELAAARREADSAEAQLGEHRLRLAELDRDGVRMEHEIDSLRARSDAERRRLLDGSIANAKELGSLQREIDSLGRRISDREDELLAMLEVRAEVERLAEGAEARSSELRAGVDGVATASQEEARTVAGELEDRVSARRVIVESVDPDVVQLYEELRRQKKGVGAVALVDGVCQGCHEQLSAVELDRFRRADGVKRCEHCRRILIPDPG